MPVCTGRGAGGDHCCYIEGQVCQFLVTQDGLPRCSLWSGQMLGNPEWEQAPVGRFLARYPGKDCHDWPQNIPEVMATGRGLCCWQGDG